MTVEALAAAVIDACEAEGVDHMVTGAFAYSLYGIPRSTKDIDVVVQKLRWGRNKDLDDARDVLAVQGPESLDMAYIENWCSRHGTTSRLQDALAGIPPLE